MQLARIQCEQPPRIECLQDDQPYAVFTDNNLGSKPEYLRQLCRALRPQEKIWIAAVLHPSEARPNMIRTSLIAFLVFASSAAAQDVDKRSLKDAVGDRFSLACRSQPPGAWRILRMRP